MRGAGVRAGGANPDIVEPSESYEQSRITGAPGRPADPLTRGTGYP